MVRIVAGLLLLIVPLWLIADEAPTPSGLAGSKHDFSVAPWSADDRCVGCHGAAAPEATAVPEWQPSASFQERFGTALEAAVSAGTAPGSGTVLCMRCHDGGLAADMFGGYVPTAANSRHAALFTAGHASNHPVGVAYPDGAADYHPRTVVEGIGGLRLPGGQVECVSCHDPHNESGLPAMLIKSNARSALCLTCHKK